MDDRIRIHRAPGQDRDPEDGSVSVDTEGAPSPSPGQVAGVAGVGQAGEPGATGRLPSSDGPSTPGSPGSGTEGPQSPRWSTVDWIYGVVVQPRETFRHLATQERPPLGLAVTLGIVVTAASGLVQGAAMVRELGTLDVPVEEPLLFPSDVAADPSVGLMAGLVLAFIGIGLWFAGVAIFHLIADLLGGEGNGRRFLCAMGFATVPVAVSLPVEAVAARGGVVGEGLGWLGALAVLAWSLSLQYQALRATKGLTRTGAVLALLLPLGIMVAAMVILLVLVIMLVALGAAASA